LSENIKYNRRFDDNGRKQKMPTEMLGIPKDAWVVVGKGTSVDNWIVIVAGADHPTGVHYSYASAKAAADAALGSPDNYYEVTILGAGNGVYRD
jgi:hypothetical protein